MAAGSLMGNAMVSKEFLLAQGASLSPYLHVYPVGGINVQQDWDGWGLRGCLGVGIPRVWGAFSLSLRLFTSMAWHKLFKMH